jgi:hypothetical protein
MCAGLLIFALTHPQWIAVAAMLAGCLLYCQWHGPDERLEWTVMAVLACLVVEFVCAAALRLSTSLRPYKLDLYIFNIDAFLGCRLDSFRHFAGRSLPLRLLLYWVYFLCPAVLLTVFVGYLWRHSRAAALRILPVPLSVTLGGLLVYLLVPVAGPLYAFPGYPALPATPLAAHPIPVNAPPNGVPSVHLSLALVIWWYARKLPLGTFLAGLYLLLTVAATLGLGEHYVFDLIVAVPYTVIVYRLVNFLLPAPGRRLSWTRRVYGAKPLVT